VFLHATSYFCFWLLVQHCFCQFWGRKHDFWRLSYFSLSGTQSPFRCFVFNLQVLLVEVRGSLCFILCAGHERATLCVHLITKRDPSSEHAMHIKNFCHCCNAKNKIGCGGCCLYALLFSIIRRKTRRRTKKRKEK